MSATGTSKIAIVTGAAHGIGRAMTLGLLGAGHHVMANDVDEDSLAALAADAGDGKSRLKTIVADVGRDESAGRIVAATREAFGGLDILINNAGVGPNTVRKGAKPTGDFRSVAPQDFRRILEVNTVAPFLMTRAAVAPMVEQHWGRVINVTTSLDSMWRKGMLPYGGSKAANEAHCCIMAEELAGTGVTVNILVPGGPVNTRLVGDNFTPAEKQKLIQPEIMVTPLLWLVSPATDTITGKRFIAAFWDENLPTGQAAEKCSALMAWQQLGRQAIFPTA
ncbi:MAG TPA: SDR family oxidoreductase [Stellaceae bacterium]|jgi:3-oxoacyl-[acyl-carrier protein] reductase